MNFKTDRQVEINATGTGLVGYVMCRYDKLVATFGEPNGNDGYKTDAEWTLLFDDGTIATIYNWKSGKNYLGKDGLDVTEIDEWNIGGNGPLAVVRVTELLSEV